MTFKMSDLYREPLETRRIHVQELLLPLHERLYDFDIVVLADASMIKFRATSPVRVDL